MATPLRFLGADLAKEQVLPLWESIAPPATIGRYKAGRPDIFDAADVAFVKSLGFETTY